MDYVLEQLHRQRSLFLTLLGRKPPKRAKADPEEPTADPTGPERESSETKTRPVWAGMRVEKNKDQLPIQSEEFPNPESKIASESEPEAELAFCRTGMTETEETGWAAEQWLAAAPDGQTVTVEDVSRQLERDARRYDGGLALF